MIVTFCGHGDLNYSTETKEAIYTHTEQLILQGANEFLMGGYGAFDRLAAQTVKQLKYVYPHIVSTLVIPYINREFDRHLYDCSLYPPIENVPKRFAISKRNLWMAENSDVLVCYIAHTYGGAYTTYLHGVRKKKKIINLAETKN